jgi:phosphoglycolate phosphatase-like HAD superfamily hydrolase
MASTRPQPAFLFDLDGTLVDNVYQHVLAWREALEGEGIQLSVWRIHRRIGMSGGLLINALVRESGRQLSDEQVEHVQRLHREAYGRLSSGMRPLPGARELLEHLTNVHVPWAIATSGHLDNARPALDALGVAAAGAGGSASGGTRPMLTATVITRDQVERGKPDPDLFIAAAERINVPIDAAIVVGDSVWDLLAARRAGALGVGLMSGGYGQDELERAGAYRVYQDPADLLRHLDEVGVR